MRAGAAENQVAGVASGETAGVSARRWAPAWLTLAGGVALSVGVFFLVSRVAREQKKADFARWAYFHQAELERKLEVHLDLLRFMGSLFFSSERVDRGEFRGFASDSLARLPAIRTLEWLPRVAAEERAGHEARLRGGEQAGYEVVERVAGGDFARAPDREVYYPVVYALPGAAERNRLGRNMAAVPEYAAAMEEAVRTNHPVLAQMDWTHPVSGRQPDWRAFLAVYRSGAAHLTLEERQENLAGFVACELRIRDLLEGTATGTNAGMRSQVGVRLVDVEGGARVISESAQWSLTAANGRFLQRFSLRVAGRHWELWCVPTAQYLAAHRSWQPWALLGAGLLLSVMAASYLFGAAGREMKINRLVRERTLELSRANKELQAEVVHRVDAERKLEQERYLMEALMESTPDHIYFKDRESRFLRISKAQAARFKLADPRLAVGRTDFDYFTAEHAQAAFTDEQAIMSSGEPMVGREEKETWPDGSVSWVSTTKQALRNQQGAIIGTFGISRDITPHKLAEEALARKTTELVRSNEELEQFAYVASHDLQEPLRMIASYTQLLARRYRGRLDADADEFIGYAVDGAGRMQTLINDLLTYSRVDRRGKPLAVTASGVAVQRALDNLKVALEDSGAVVQVGDLPEVMADEVQLTQLFQNLVSNAIKFRKENRPEIRIDAAPQAAAPDPGEPPRSEWVFRVQDNGIGIEPDYFERIFIIFQRLHTRDQYPGTGIGLAVCKKIVERHGGRIWVESQVGRGTTFYFTLPRMRPAA